MALKFNGVTIPTDVANALKFNGVNITRVVANGAEVWKQELFSATWSGNAYSTYSTTNEAGMETSGSNARMVETKPSSEQDIWLTANTDGTFQAGTSNVIFSNATRGFTFSGNTMKTDHGNNGATNGTLTFDKKNGWSGESWYGSVQDTWWQSSGGLLRFRVRSTYQWSGFISLT